MRSVYDMSETLEIVDKHKMALEAIRRRDQDALEVAIRADILDAMHLLRQTLAPLMLARRPPDGENPRVGQGQGQATPFLSRIGLRVLINQLLLLAESDAGRLQAPTEPVEFDGIVRKTIRDIGYRFEIGRE